MEQELGIAIGERACGAEVCETVMHTKESSTSPAAAGLASLRPARPSRGTRHAEAAAS